MRNKILEEDIDTFLEKLLSLWSRTKRNIFAIITNSKSNIFRIQINAPLKKTNGNSIMLVKQILMIFNVQLLQINQVNQEITMASLLLWKIIQNHILPRIFSQLFNMVDGDLLPLACLISI